MPRHYVTAGFPRIALKSDPPLHKKLESDLARDDVARSQVGYRPGT